MRWPWQRPIVEHRSSYTDAVVTAILQSASGGSVRTALATAAVESAATLYSSAMASCSISGPSSVVRAFNATWRAATASELIRRGQCVYIIGADPVDGLSLAPAASWDVHGGALPASWVYRVQLAGPSGTAWETRVSGEVLHLRWLSDPASPWAGVSPLQRAVDTASLSGWLDKRLAEEASGPVGAFLPVAKYDANPDADLDADDADDPLAACCGGISAARRAKCSRSSPKWRRRILRPVPHGKILWCSDSARIRHAILSSCANRSHATSGRRAGSRAPYSTPRPVDKPVAKPGGNLSRRRLTVSRGVSKRRSTTSSGSTSRLIPGRWAGAISWGALRCFGGSRRAV